MITPPTDNLYKFCAITGLLLVVFSTYYNFEMYQKSVEKEILHIQELRKLNISLQESNEFLTYFKNQIEKSESILKKFEVDKNTLFTDFENGKISHKDFKERTISIDLKFDNFIKNDENNIELLRREQLLNNHKIKYKKIELESNEILLRIEKNKLGFYKFSFTIGIITGFIIGLFGFKKWYKIQKKMDNKLFSN